MLPKPPNGYLNRSTADGLLTSFVFAQRFDAPTALPKRAEPTQVDEFLRKAFERERPDRRQLSQAGELLRFFDLRKRVEPMTKWLDRRERQADEFVRSMTAVALLGDLGNDAQQQQAAEYYKFLVTRSQAETQYTQLVDLFFHLPEKADPKWISDPLEEKRKALAPDIASNQDAEVKYHELGELKDNRLPRILEARKLKFEILALKDAIRRRRELARAYLRLESFPHVDLNEWAVMLLQRECNAGDPPDLVEPFAHLLGLLMSPASVTDSSGQRLDPEDEKPCVTSCARALEFYLGKLDAKQAEYVDKHKVPEQNDTLYWEPEEGQT